MTSSPEDSVNSDINAIGSNKRVISDVSLMQNKRSKMGEQEKDSGSDELYIKKPSADEALKASDSRDLSQQSVVDAFLEKKRKREDEKQQAERNIKSTQDIDINDMEALEKAHFSFPERLFELLEEEKEKDALWWLSDGDAFAIVPKVFPDQVLNKYFQGTKFESFTRKLNRWGFKRLGGQRVPPNTIAYYHNDFQRGQPDLVKNLRSGKRTDSDSRNVLVQGQLQRDLQAANLATRQSQDLPIGGFGLDASSLLQAQLLQNQTPRNLQSLPLQSLFASQQDLSMQRQAQLLAAEQARQQAILLGATGYGNIGGGFNFSNQDLASMLGGTNNTSSLQQNDPRLLQLLLLQQRQREQQQQQQNRFNKDR